MRPIFAVTTGASLYFLWGIFAVISEYGLSQPKALFGSVIGTLLFGYIALHEFQTMLRGADAKHLKEVKWVKANIQTGAAIAEAKVLLHERFTLKQEAAGFALSAGSTKVHDFTNTVADLRIVTKHDTIISVEVTAPRERRA